MVKARVPTGALAPAVKLRVVDPDDVTDKGLNVTVTWFGRRLVANVVTPTNPPEGVSVTSTWPQAPARVMVMALDDADKEKSPGEFIRSGKGAVRLSAPIVPFTIMV